MNRICYKVLLRRRSDNALVSAITNDEGWVKKYVPKRWTVGKKNSLLFVFNTLREAKIFALSSWYEIWRCEVTNSRKMSMLCNFLSPESFANWWKGKRNNGVNEEMHAQIGTRGCESLRLLKRII